LLVQQVAKRAARGVIRDVEAPPSERVSRSESEPDSASLRKWRADSPPKSGEIRTSGLMRGRATALPPRGFLCPPSLAKTPRAPRFLAFR